MPAKIKNSHYYATPRQLTAASAGAYAVLSPTASPASGDKIKPGVVVGVTTGQIVALPGQAKGKYFIEVKRPNGSLAWVLNSYVVLPRASAAAVLTKAGQVVDKAGQMLNAAGQLRPGRARPAAQTAARPATAPARATGNTRPAGKPTGRAARPAGRPAQAAPTVKTGDGASALQAIIGNDQKTHFWLVQALYWQAKASQISGPTAELLSKKLTVLIASYNTRQAKIKGSRYVKVSTGVNDTVQGWLTRLKGLVGMNGIGLLPALPAVPILVGAVVAAALIGGLWLLLRDDVPRSVNDLHEAAKLTETYRSMSQEEKELFDKTTDEAGKAGADSTKKSFLDTLKDNVLLIGGGLLLASVLSKKKK